MLIPQGQKAEVRRMTVLIGVLFLLIVQRNVLEIFAFTNFNINGVHILTFLRESLLYVFLTLLSVGALSASYLISMSMVMSQQRGRQGEAGNREGYRESVDVLDDDDDQ